MNFNDKFFGHKNFLITQDKFGQCCALVSKARVSQRLVKVPNPAHPLVPLPPWSGLVTITADASCKD